MSARPGFHYTGEGKGNRLSPKQVERLARKYGLPARAMAQIARGESGLDASVQQRDPGDGMVGYGLLQMTPNAWGPEAKAYMRKLGGIRAMADPEKNMQMARYLYKGAGNSLSPWHGTRYLTDRSGEGRLGPVRQNLQVPGLRGGGGGSGVQAPLSSTSTPNVAELLSTLVGGRQARPQTAAPPVLSFSAQAPLPAAQLPGGAEQTQSAAPEPKAEPDYGQILSQLTDLIGGTVAQREAAGAPGESQIGTKGEVGSKNPSKLYELFWNGPGATNVKNGERVGKGFVSGHTDHVHVASNQKSLLRLGQLAQSMGLHVGENPAFGSVNPVHVKDSYHYGRTRGDEHDRAIDVSGDTAAMRKFARKVAQIYRL